MENYNENFDSESNNSGFFRNYRAIHCHFGGYGFREESYTQYVELND